MAWIDSYRQASFRGVEFFVEGHDASFGRRQVTHEFPQRDTPYTEDLGRRAREFTVDAYLIGDDYPALRDRLISACETAGPGQLVHPYLGEMTVDCTGLVVRETSSELRMCRVQLSFVEAGEPALPSSVSDPVRAIAAAGAGASAASSAAFQGRFTASGLPSYVGVAASELVTSLADLAQDIPISPSSADPQGVAAFFARARALASASTTIVDSPSGLATEVLALIGGVRNVFGPRADDALRAIRDAFSGSYSGPLTTANRLQDRDNADSFSALVRRISIIEQVQFAVLQTQPAAEVVGRADPFQTRDEAVAARDELADLLDVEMEDPATGPEEFSALSALRAELVASVPGEDLQLPRLASITPAATVSSLVLAYSLYADAGRAQGLAELNRAPHPGFLPGGQPLQVVTDV